MGNSISSRRFLPVADVDFGTRWFAAMDLPVDLSPPFLSPFFFGYTVYARSFPTWNERWNDFERGSRWRKVRFEDRREPMIDVMG